MSQTLTRMRPSAVYVVVTLIFASFVVILFVKHAGWGMQMYSVTMDDRFVQENDPNTAAHHPPMTADNFDINEFISSQAHYKKLCELDR